MADLFHPEVRQPVAPSELKIGVLALQGDYDAHAKTLAALGATVRLIRTPRDLEDDSDGRKVDGLVLPGGESTTMLKFLERDGFFATLGSFVRETPTFGTCAGCILLANVVENPAQRSLSALDVTVSRNAYGRQNESSIHIAETTLTGGPLEMVFIRAPKITRLGSGVETLATLDGDPVLVRSGHVLAATFHPELSDDTRIHALFLALVDQHHAERSAGVS